MARAPRACACACARPVLTVDAHPVDPTLLLVGDMAGKSAVINFDSPEPVFAATPHAKYSPAYHLAAAAAAAAAATATAPTQSA